MTTPLNHRLAVYTGTFDPVHRGHLDIISRGSRIFDRLIVGVGIFYAAKRKIWAAVH